MSFDQEERDAGPALTPQPPVTLADCAREDWAVLIRCEPCRMLTYVSAKDYDPVTANHPIADAWPEGWIVCPACRTPVSGLVVEDRGSYGRRPRVLERCSLPGCWPDPTYRDRWRGG